MCEKCVWVGDYWEFVSAMVSGEKLLQNLDVVHRILQSDLPEANRENSPLWGWAGSLVYSLVLMLSKLLEMVSNVSPLLSLMWRCTNAVMSLSIIWEWWDLESLQSIVVNMESMQYDYAGFISSILRWNQHLGPENLRFARITLAPALTYNTISSHPSWGPVPCSNKNLLNHCWRCRQHSGHT